MNTENVVNVTITGIVPLEFECLEGHQPTPAQIEWIIELYLEAMVKVPVEERIKSAISGEEEIAWAAYDAFKEDIPEFIEQMIMLEEIDEYLKSEDPENVEGVDSESESDETA